MELTSKKVGDQAILFIFKKEISREVNTYVRMLHEYLSLRKVGIISMVPTYCALLVLFDKKKTSFKKLERVAYSWKKKVKDISITDSESDIITIPCCYEDEYAPDLNLLSEDLNLSKEEIISLHSERLYPIYMMGFLPGFPYLGNLNERLFAKRLDTPRKEIEKGSVGIGGTQTGIYPSVSPGGWKLIGRTPISLFDEVNKKALLSVGKVIRFQPITKEKFLILENEEKEKEKKKKENVLSEKRDEKHALFKVNRTGSFTSVQGESDPTHMHLGITEKGVMDEISFHLGNLILGNKKSARSLELTFMGPEIVFLKDTKICITGADMKPELNGKRIVLNQCVEICKDDVLSFSWCEEGMRTYIAFLNGLFMENGFKPEMNDIIYENEESEKNPFSLFHKKEVKRLLKLQKDFEKEKKDRKVTKIRVILGPQDEMFTDGGIQTFLSEKYDVTSDSNRMGIRLSGKEIESMSGTDIISDGIVKGSIQVPKNGLPIILLSDHQTTGGYAKIATVVSEDLWKLSSLRPGEKVCFTESTEMAKKST